MATKHERILEYIENLDIGHKISVRQIARELGFSEGTAYRAIKDAEVQGLVTTVERVGTVRIEKKTRSEIERLTFAEVVNIVDGQVLGGKEGLYKTLNRFVIGAMKLEAMIRYVEPGNLLIVGNRDNAHQISLERGAAVLITGGFDATDKVKQLADQMELPVISCTYDTFTVAAMINRAIYDRLIKKDILLVEDVLTPDHLPDVLCLHDTIDNFHQLVIETGHSRYPVVDDEGRLYGMITAKDVVGHSSEVTVDGVMTKNPITVTPMTSLAAAAHEMVWEGIELLPVVSSHHQLLGVISRQDVIKSLQYMQKQPQVGETIDDLIFRGFEEVRESNGDMVYKGMITPQMTDPLGTLSIGVLTSLLTEAGYRRLRRQHRGDMVVDNLTLYFLKPVQLEQEVIIVPHLIDIGRKTGKVDVEVFHGDHVVAKALVTAQLIER
ncbi:Predicted transcriptional regulator containing CBS domains [Marininema mesophilum]|uniref:Predicted transcriptional regulator containing CBS domains n=1 Tax=Marininema mesophilum TaxID=1048340 RepID=A0A1H2XYK0_9BACL|nr:DRTGG domain-containing protein [Marininema mesophilum]SDW97514.1 Predicted transcriptional regulator containing CBS domains [Marininema mesophilum]